MWHSCVWLYIIFQFVRFPLLCAKFDFKWLSSLGVLSFYGTQLMNALHISLHYRRDCLASNSYFAFLFQMTLYRLRSDIASYRTPEKMQNRVSEMRCFVMQFTLFVCFRTLPPPLGVSYAYSPFLQLLAYCYRFVSPAACWRPFYVCSFITEDIYRCWFCLIPFLIPDYCIRF